MVVGFTTTYAISAYHHWLATGRWFSPGPPVSSTNKTDRHDITEVLLKVPLNTIKHKTNKQAIFYVQGFMDFPIQETLIYLPSPGWALLLCLVYCSHQLHHHVSQEIYYAFSFQFRAIMSAVTRKDDFRVFFTPICFLVDVLSTNILFVFIYVYWCSTRFLYQMMLFNSKTTGVTSGVRTANTGSCCSICSFLCSVLSLVE